MTETSFLAWHRSGLAALAKAAPTGDRGQVRMSVVLNATNAEDAISESDLDLLGPGDIAGLAEDFLAERVPPLGCVDAAPGTLCSLSFRDAALPWALPTAADAAGAPVPWLALLCLPEESATIDAATRPLPRLRLGTDAAAYLPEPGLLPLLAHAEIRDGTPHLARLLAPTRLVAGTPYLAALVPTRLAGVQAGLGEIANGATGFAWSQDNVPEALPIYAHWRFRCGTVPRFEDVVARLTPAPEAGIAPQARLTPASLRLIELDANRNVAVPLRAPFRTVGTVTEPEDDVVQAIAEKLETAPDTADALALPVYGRHQASSKDAAWAKDIATTPSLRLGAGLGARVVRRHRDALADFAVKQVGEIDRANAMLARARAALEARRTLHESLAVSDRPGARPAELLMLFGPGWRRIRTSGAPLGTAIPAWAQSLSDPAVRRTLTGPRARAAGGVPRGHMSTAAPNLEEELVQARGAANKPRRAAGRATLSLLPAGAQEIENLPPFRKSDDLFDALETVFEDGVEWTNASRLAETRRAVELEAHERSRGAGRPPAHSEWLGAAAKAAMEAVDPATAIPRRVRARMSINLPGREPYDLAPIRWEPPWQEPLIDLLAREDPALVAPAAAALPPDGVVLLSLDVPMIEALLAGANHTAVSDLIWRRFPVRPEMSPVRRLFPRADIAGLEAPPFDVAPLRTWSSHVGGNLSRVHGQAARKPAAIVLMRTPLFELFPGMLVYAVPGRREGDEVLPSDDAAQREGPMVFGRLGQGLAYLGFATPAAEMAADPGWFLVFQGPDDLGSFALATSAGGAGPAWENFTDNGDPAVRLALTTESGTPTPIAGRDAAAAAALLLDRPLTVALHASRLVAP